MIRAFALALVFVSGAAAGVPAQRGTMQVGDATLRYDLAGQGTPVVLIHGWALDLEIWDDQVRALTPRYRVLRYDRRGYGRSTGHADDTADPDDLRILMDSLRIEKAVILGLSAGGGVAMDFAVAFPERVLALVLYGSGPPDGFQPMPPGPPPIELFGRIAREHGLDSLKQFIGAMGVSWTPPDRPEAARMIDSLWARYDARDLLDPRPPSGRVAQARLEQLPRVRVPTLIVVGDHEMPFLRTVADTLARRIPGARFEVIADAGHGAHFAQPERFNALLLDFLAGVERARRTRD